MTWNQNRLATLFVREHFGDLVEPVVVALLSKGRQNLRQLRKNVEMAKRQNQSQFTLKDFKKIKRALKVLIQHSLVKYSKQEDRPVVEYEADKKRILAILQYPLMILSAKEMFGDDAEVIVEEMLRKGCLTMVQVVANVTDRLNVAMEAEGEAPIPYAQVQETFKNLVKCRFMERLPEATSSSTHATPQYRFSVPDVSVANVVNERRRREAEADQGEGPSRPKRPKIDAAVNAPYASPDDGIYWRMNEERFDLLFRDRLLVKAIENRLRDRSAAEVFRAMLRLNELSSDATSETSALLSAAEVFRLLPSDLNLTMDVFDRYANALVEDRCDFVRKTTETAGLGATFCLNLRGALANFALSHVESFIQERYGVKALRILRMLKAKGQMEQHKIEEAAMMPAKETKDVCYRLFTENILSLTEIPRTPDHAPSRTLYLFHLHFDNLVRLLLDRSYKAVSNLKERWWHETQRNGRILDKQCKVEGIYANQQQCGATEEQLQEIEEMLSPVEREQLEKVKLVRDKLQRTELSSMETILILEQYLAMEAFHGAKAAMPARKPTAII